MLFNSLEFILVFLPAAFLVYFWLNQKRLILAGKSWLVLASLVFYAWWNVQYLPLILVSILANFAVGSALAKRASGGSRGPLKPEWLLAAGIVFDLGLLGYYKYADFFLSNLGRLVDAPPEPLGIVLPLAISFFTFTQIAYLVDSYRGKAKEYDLLNYALFVTFFPHLIAGPVVHHREIMPQFAAVANLARRYRNVLLGLMLFSVGLAKKVLIADTFAGWATAGFDQADHLNLFEAWVTSLSYTFQIYFDFSGYTDMALGAAMLFNIRMPFNFNSLYRATTIQDFWRRWHITLSRFLRDYLYIPLGGSRRRQRCRLWAAGSGIAVDPDGLEVFRIHLFQFPRWTRTPENLSSSWFWPRWGRLRHSCPHCLSMTRWRCFTSPGGDPKRCMKTCACRWPA